MIKWKRNNKLNYFIIPYHIFFNLNITKKLNKTKKKFKYRHLTDIYNIINFNYYHFHKYNQHNLSYHHFYYNQHIFFSFHHYDQQ